MSRQTDFIKTIAPGAVEGMKNHGICASMSIAQAILESGWGRSAIGHNMFGIKAGPNWHGATKTVRTKEWDGKKYITINAAFRDYPSFSASIEDHTMFLLQNSRYKNLIGVKDYRTACELIHRDGYATSPTYAKSLISLIETWHLSQYDAESPSGIKFEIVKNGTKVYNYPSVNPLKSKVMGNLNSGTVIFIDWISTDKRWGRYVSGHRQLFVMLGAAKRY